MLSGLKPLPPRPRRCEFDYGIGFEMGRKGRARAVCASDSVYTPKGRTLGYGSTWKRGGFVCTSKQVGLRCRNLVGHGFFESRGRSYRF